MSKSFENAQEARQLLTDYGFIPLTKVEGAEHWVRETRRVTLFWEGEYPIEAELRRMVGATAVYRGEWWELSLH